MLLYVLSFTLIASHTMYMYSLVHVCSIGQLWCSCSLHALAQAPSITCMQLLIEFMMATKGKGRPRKQLLPPSVVTIEGREVAESTTRHDCQPRSALFTLCIPLRLLLEWHKRTECPEDYVRLLNANIEGEAVVVHHDCEDVSRR